MAQFAFAEAFFEHYFPHDPAPALSLDAEELKPFTGTYRSTLINLTTLQKFNNLMQSHDRALRRQWQLTALQWGHTSHGS